MADFLNLVVFSNFDHVIQILRIFKVDIRNLRTRITLYTEFQTYRWIFEKSQNFEGLAETKTRPNFKFSQNVTKLGI